MNEEETEPTRFMQYRDELHLKLDAKKVEFFLVTQKQSLAHTRHTPTVRETENHFKCLNAMAFKFNHKETT